MVGGRTDLCPITIRALGKGPSPSAAPQASSSSCSVASFPAFFYGGLGWGEGRVFLTQLALLLRKYFLRCVFF